MAPRRDVRDVRFDGRVRPTMRREWAGLWPRRYGGFWWRVAYVVREWRIRHSDHDRIREVCAAVDEAFPQHRRPPAPPAPASPVLPEYREKTP